MAITLMAPEFIIGKACESLWSARKYTTQLSRLAQEDGVHWTIAHTFYAEMGGFILEFDGIDTGEETEQRDDARDSNVARIISDEEWVQFRNFPGWEMERLRKQGHVRWQRDPQYDIMIRESLSEACSKVRHKKKTREALVNFKDWLGSSYEIDETRLVRKNQYITTLLRDLGVLKGTTWVLCIRQLIEARELGIIDKLPNLRDAELEDKDKSDFLAKSLAFIQITWLIIQLSFRWKDGKSCSQLEIMTLSFAVSSIIVYFLHWSRPHDITAPTLVPAKRVTKDQMKHIAFFGQNHVYDEELDGGLLIRHDAYSLRKPYFLGGLIGAALFGAFHFIAWDFEFPTRIESVLWKVSSFMTVFCPIGTVTFFYLANNLIIIMGRAAPYWLYTWSSIFSFLAVAFVLARIFLLVESFRTLYFLPPDAFTATWAANIPHFS